MSGPRFFEFQETKSTENITISELIMAVEGLVIESHEISGSGENFHKTQSMLELYRRHLSLIRIEGSEEMLSFPPPFEVREGNKKSVIVTSMALAENSKIKRDEKNNNNINLSLRPYQEHIENAKCLLKSGLENSKPSCFGFKNSYSITSSMRLYLLMLLEYCSSFQDYNKSMAYLGAIMDFIQSLVQTTAAPKCQLIFFCGRSANESADDIRLTHVWAQLSQARQELKNVHEAATIGVACLER